MTIDEMLMTSCLLCGRRDRKKNLVRIGARVGNYCALRLIGHVCQECFSTICSRAGVDPNRYD